MSTLKVADIDFNNIKNNLKNYLNAQDTFKDYDFDGSALATIIDVLAYNTHYNAVNANMLINEAFLDTAQLRQSVVSHAKMLGYTPRSVTPPVATINITINDSDAEGNITLERDTKFSTQIDNVTYYFVTKNTYLTDSNTFSNVEIYEGSYKSVEYIFDINSEDAYIIPDKNVYLDSLIVQVLDTEESTTLQTFTLAGNIVNLDSTSNVYFVQENKNGYYEITFGDGIIGNALRNGSKINMNYISSAGATANGATIFNLIGNIQNYSNVTITTVNKAAGGTAKENIASIKYNAPLNYTSQNRAVTAEDYKTILLSSYGDIDSISVWGGEDNDPPVYGKVYISIKPATAETLTTTEKEFIISQYLKTKNVISITPEIIDPSFTYIYLEIFFKYNPNLTSSTVEEIQNIVRQTITTYNNNELKKFDGIFRYSNFLNSIDDSDFSIINSLARVYVRKNLTPTPGVRSRYELKYATSFLSSSNTSSIVSSTSFTYSGLTNCSITDKQNDDGTRRLRIVRGGTGDSALVEDYIGEVDITNGIIILYDFTVNSYQGDYITVTVLPSSNDLAPKRNEILSILTEETRITGEIDTAVTGGTRAGVDYTTTPTII